MRRLLPIAATLAAVACAPSVYVPPAMSEPHALVTVRTLHHEASGPHMAFGVRLDGFQVPVGVVDARTTGTPLTRTVRVRPGAARFLFASRFTHTVSRTVTVMRSEQYACGTQTSGYGASSYTSTRFCTRMVPGSELRTETVVDGACEATVALTPEVGGRYVVQYDYYANGMCSGRCFARTALAGDQFQLVPCGQEPLSHAPEPTRADPQIAPESSGAEQAPSSPSQELTAP